MSTMSSSRPIAYWWALAAILVVAFSLRMFVAYAMPNMIWPDEIFQTMEQAHRAVFGNGMVPWEFRQGTRSWMLPGFLAGVIACTSVVTSSVTAYLMAAAASMSLISLVPLWAAFRAAWHQLGMRGAIVAGSFVALWFELLFFAPKALSEVVAGNVFAAGAVLAGACVTTAREGGTVRNRQLVAVASLLTLSAMMRIQLAIAAGALFFIVIAKIRGRARLLALAVATGVVLAAGLLDAVTWDYPFQSFIENIRMNILEGKSSYYGTASWVSYFVVYGRIWGVWSIIIIALAVLGTRRAPLLGLGVLLVLAAHIPIAHKEYRFLYPAMLLVVILAGLGAATIVRWIEDRKGARKASLAVVGFIALWFTISMSGASAFHASKTQLAFHYGEEQDHWFRRRGGLLGMRALGEEPAICGVGLAGIGWGDTGGYTYLHRKIPIFPFPNQDVLWKFVPHFNAMLVQPGKAETLGPFQRQQCWEDACIYVRDGACVELTTWDINTVLERAGQ
jgi:GPI mannosyltransferase 3